MKVVKLLQDLDQMGKWTKKQQLEFNTGKCKLRHFEKFNLRNTRIVNDKALCWCRRTEIDLGYKFLQVATQRQGGEGGVWHTFLHTTMH